MAATKAPQYAPEDPSLPKPWKGLVDGNTGYLYFWNPETNVTQYERPGAKSTRDSLPLKSDSGPISSSVQSSHVSSSHGHHRSSRNDDDGRHHGSSNGMPKLAPIPEARNHQSMKNGGGYSSGAPNGYVSDGLGSAKVHVSDTGTGISVDSYRRQHEITVNGQDIPPPFMSFDSTAFPSEILREVKQAGFAAPTPIQAQSWPIALEGRDIVAIAKTGSGKTLGYLIPGFIHLKQTRNNSRMGPTVLVLSPTRELATQIQAEAVKFSRSSRISCTCLYGGAPKGPQLRDIERGTDIVVATPGRLNDILEMRKISLRQVSYLVLDEADRMLDMGFEPQIRKIVNEIPTNRQTLMYTATWPKEVRKIAADLLRKPAQVNIGKIDELVANKSITQLVEVLAPLEKNRRLEQILRSQEPGSKVIIFCSTKKMCDQLSRTVTRQFGAAAIHGDKSQGDRDYVLNQFRSGRCPILVATDVAARGLDVKDIRVVINYDFPTGIEDYVHRIGRTGRAGATGLAITFFCDQDAKHARDLIKVLEGANQKVPPQIRDMSSRGGGKLLRKWGSGPGGRDGGGRGGRNSNSGYGGRGSGGPPQSSGWSDRGHGGGRGQGRDSHDSYGRSNVDTHDYRGYDDRRSAEKDIIHSRSPNRRSGFSKSHSRSPARYGPAPVARGRSPPPRRDTHSPYHSREVGLRKRSASPFEDRKKARSSYDPPNKLYGRSPIRKTDSGKSQPSGLLSFHGEEEEEEGLIHDDDDVRPNILD